MLPAVLDAEFDPGQLVGGVRRPNPDDRADFHRPAHREAQAAPRPVYHDGCHGFALEPGSLHQDLHRTPPAAQGGPPLPRAFAALATLPVLRGTLLGLVALL